MSSKIIREINTRNIEAYKHTNFQGVPAITIVNPLTGKAVTYVQEGPTKTTPTDVLHTDIYHKANGFKRMHQLEESFDFVDEDDE